jgi:hypothetical protein
MAPTDRTLTRQLALCAMWLCTLGSGTALAGEQESAPPARDIALYAGCFASAPDAPAPMLKCRTWTAFNQTMSLGGESPEVVLEAHFAGLAKGGNCVREGDQGIFKIGEEAYPSHAVNCSSAQTPRMPSRVVWSTRSADKIAISMCSYSVRDAGGAARCDQVLADLVQHGMPPGIPTFLPESIPHIIGRPVTVPDGCQVQTQPHKSTLLCKDSGTLLEWVQIRDQATPELLSAARANFKKMLEATRPGAQWTEASTPCAIEGVSSTCWRFTQPLEGKEDHRIAVFGYGEFQGIGLLVTCLYQGPSAADFSAVCQKVLKSAP